MRAEDGPSSARIYLETTMICARHPNQRSFYAYRYEVWGNVGR